MVLAKGLMKRKPGSIALAVPLAAALLSWPSADLQGTPPQGDEHAASGKASPSETRALTVALHAPVADASSASTYRAVLDQYCVVCHNQQLRTAGLTLDKLDVANVSDNAPVWEKVVNKLRTAAMPPAGMPRPDQATYDSFAAYLETALDRSAAAQPNPGRPAVHRLNRTEYANVIRDLLAVDIDVESLLPVDDSDYGFDNIADVLSVSPTLLERCVSAAGKITRAAIGDLTLRPVSATYDVPGFLFQDDRMNEDLPFGSRGGMAINHFFPLDGDYVLKIHLRRDPGDRILGLEEPHQLDIRLDGTRIKLLTVGGDYPVAKDSEPAISPLTRRKIVDDRFYDRKDADRNKYESTADANLEVRFSAKAGPRLVGVTFLDEGAEAEGALQSHMVGYYSYRRKILKGSGPALDQVVIDGPYDAKGLGDTPSRRKIFVCYPGGSRDEAPCAKRILSTLARRAFRRSVTDRDVAALMKLYDGERRDGGNFEAGISMAIQGMLVSPDFLFRVEHDAPNLAPGTAFRISDLELASRLSFFLWSSIPDDELLDLAAAGKLKDSAVLDKQVRRMLADSRSKALVTNFGGQWLYLRNMPRMTPDANAFVDFDENLRQAFEKETELFLESNLQEDRSVLNLLDANYTFVNERLANFYGIPNVFGNQFRRVPLDSHPERRGLLGQGSILTVTSYANRTSPTVRGKWLLENVLGTPPPPPPADVPSLKEDNTRNGKILTMRERMEEHRANPACAVCHARMDPLGFALENFDGIGKWRTVSEANTPIDASGVLPDGTKFDGPDGLRKILLSHPEQFATTVTERLLTYALGRGLEYYDEPAIRKITRDAAAHDYRWSSLIVGIVNSVPFQMRISKPQQPSATRTIASQNAVTRESKP